MGWLDRPAISSGFLRGQLRKIKTEQPFLPFNPRKVGPGAAHYLSGTARLMSLQASKKQRP